MEAPARVISPTLPSRGERGPLSSETQGQRITLLDGGAEAYPRMLEAIDAATRRVHLEVYAFEREGVGERFISALTAAAHRGVQVKVIVDGWGSIGDSRELAELLRAAGIKVRIHNPLTSVFLGRFWRNHRKILLVDDTVAFLGGINIGDHYAAEEGRPGWADLALELLRAAGIKVRIHNPLTSVFLGRFWRNHRKILLVDDTVAFLGGINIGDHYAAEEGRPGWADLALELRGDICARLGARLTAGASTLAAGPVSILLSGFGGGRRLKGRYLTALKEAKQRVVLAHAYFLPDTGFVRALKRAARRGVEVHLLLAGRSDVPFARAATMRLYYTLLRAGVHIHEWTDTTLHAKAAVVDGQCLLVGSFNLDPLSLVNLETLVEVDDAGVAAQATRWMERHVGLSRPVRLEDCARSGPQRWLLDVVGLAVARFSERVATFMGSRSMRRRG